MPEIDVSPLEKIIQPYVPLGASGLLPALHAAQKHYDWLPEEVASEIAKALKVPLADVHGVIEFYSLFYNEPIGKQVTRVCTDIACALKGADEILKHHCAHHNIQPGQTTPDLATTIEASPCLGMCELAPVAMIDEEVVTDINLDAGTSETGPRSIIGGSLRLLTANCGQDEPAYLSSYGKYNAFEKALKMGSAEVIEEIKSSGLVGRGGAAFPTGVKWAGAADADGDVKYVICNADESEPGTFKDRILLRDDPHSIIEGMLIAAFSAGASIGYIYLRGEYPYIRPVLERAISEAHEAGYLGTNIQKTEFSFDIEIFVGAGAYICGEETALFESIEGKRGFPRIKPPFPTTHGLFGKPTVVNNVETLANVPLIFNIGADEFRKIGTEKSPGPKLFCLSGDVEKPGLYEVPFGVTLRELIDMAGGVAGGKTIQTILFGGAAGTFAMPDQLDVKLTFEDTRAAGLSLGSGVVMIFDESRDIRQALANLGKFFAHESCGKCYPCQMGTQRQMEILNRVADGAILPGDLERLEDVGWTMADSSLCGLGYTASTAVLSAIKEFPEIFSENGK